MSETTCNYDYAELMTGLEGLIDTKISQLMDSQREEMQSEIESIITNNRLEHEAFLLDYMSESKRDEIVEQSAVQLPSQRIVVTKSVTFGDVAIITLLLFIAANLAGKQLYQKLKDLF